MTRLALNNLLARWSRALTAIVGASIAISIAFVMTGIVNGFGSETTRTLAAIGDHYLVPEGALGLISGVTEESDGPAGTRPIAFGRDALRDKNIDLNIFGVDPNSLQVETGRVFEANNEVVIDESAGAAVGDVLKVADLELTVVGVTDGLRVFAGGPVAFLSLETAQGMFYAGQPLVSGFVADEPVTASAGLDVLSVAEAKLDMDRAVKGAVDTIIMTRTLLWVMVAGIIFVLNRLNMLDRRSELATLKCLGASTRSMGVALMVESLLVGLLSGISGCIAGWLLKPLFALEIEISQFDVIRILAFTVGVSLLVGAMVTFQLRRIVPSDAFRGEL